MSDSSQIQQVAAILRQANQHKELIDPIRNIIGAQDAALAYEIQLVNNRLRLAEGAKRIGCKIGLTSPVVQKQFGIDQPDFGWLMDDMKVENGGSLAFKELMQPKAEGELAFVINKELADPALSMDQLKAAIAYVQASIEIVGSRIRNWDISITDTIADNASASHFVLGDAQVPLQDIDLLNFRMELFSNGEKKSTGSGKDCLGNPLHAVIWLTRTMAEMGQPLQAGDVVLSGALGPMVNIEQGDELSATFDGMGDVHIKIS
ncbi:MAG: fumarylacetoacetate hydrolase family protein [Bacteroidota bacterium]